MRNRIQIKSGASKYAWIPASGLLISILGFVMPLDAQVPGTKESGLIRPSSFKVRTIGSGSSNDVLNSGSTKRKVRYSGKTVEAELFTPKISRHSPLAVEVFFIGRSEATKETWVFDSGLKFSVSPMEKLQFNSRDLFAEDKRVSTWSFGVDHETTLNVMVERIVDGSSIAGWIARCRSGLDIVEIAASSRPLEDLAKSRPEVLDNVIRSRFRELLAIRKTESKVLGFVAYPEASWFEALSSAELMGGTLVGVDTVETNDQIGSVLRELQLPSMWIGGFWNLGFKWTNGVDIAFVGFPGGVVPSSVGFALIQNDGSWLWTDNNAPGTSGFIVEWPDEEYLGWLRSFGYVRTTDTTE